jgi:hypothetical protein
MEAKTTLASLDGGSLEDVARHLEDPLRGKRTDFVDGILDVGVGPLFLVGKAPLHVNLADK